MNNSNAISQGITKQFLQSLENSCYSNRRVDRVRLEHLTSQINLIRKKENQDFKQFYDESNLFLDEYFEKYLKRLEDMPRIEKILFKFLGSFIFGEIPSQYEYVLSQVVELKIKLNEIYFQNKNDENINRKIEVIQVQIQNKLNEIGTLHIGTINSFCYGILNKNDENIIQKIEVIQALIQDKFDDIGTLHLDILHSFCSGMLTKNDLGIILYETGVYDAIKEKHPEFTPAKIADLLSFTPSMHRDKTKGIYSSLQKVFSSVEKWKNENINNGTEIDHDRWHEKYEDAIFTGFKLNDHAKKIINELNKTKNRKVKN